MNRTDKKRFSETSSDLNRDDMNFSALGAENSSRITSGGFRTEAIPFIRPWGEKSTPESAASEPSREAIRRDPPAPPPAFAATGPAASFGREH
ncbi:hypothetical protein EVAR_24396_1 [Eumeta japonica]|uniref:Uncharacterized protein n=1 Tax=Eumeta variegata TaxID=151549 RepID=A0A4C1VQU5_EUMVA|nr:hypothetical protein EVAR_24396_1 [Eumeta japonica]